MAGATDNNPESQRPDSAISSHMSDIVDEDLDAGQTAPAAIPQPPPTRKGPPRSRNSLGLSSYSEPTRPGSAASRMSRTHVPLTTSPAFFRPMSSQRLQAQRGTRPSISGPAAASEDGASDAASQARRSMISTSTMKAGAYMTTQDIDRPPPSRGTEFTDPIIPDRNTSNASPLGNTTARSLGESVRLLNNRPSGTQDLGKSFKQQILHEQPPKSARSFSGNFLMPGKVGSQNDTSQHERLSSNASSPRSAAHKLAQPIPVVNKEKNYQYFTGNTVFCGGGRLQNARDKPVNIATGIFVILPAILFFVFS